MSDSYQNFLKLRSKCRYVLNSDKIENQSFNLVNDCIDHDYFSEDICIAAGGGYFSRSETDPNWEIPNYFSFSSFLIYDENNIEISEMTFLEYQRYIKINLLVNE